MSPFHDVRFPFALALGARGGVERRTEIVTLGSGFEERNTPWAHGRRRWDAGGAVRRRADLAEIVAFFEARRGPLCGFRFPDPLDRASAPLGAAPSPQDQTIGVGDGLAASFQLVKAYGAGEGTYLRPIRKPVAGTVRVAVDGAEQLDASVDAASGVVSFAAPPAAGAPITAGFEFDTPVRFDVDRLEIDLAAFEAGAAPSIPLIEIRV